MQGSDDATARQTNKQNIRGVQYHWFIPFIVAFFHSMPPSSVGNLAKMGI
jgi:hypothetical protein